MRTLHKLLRQADFSSVNGFVSLFHSLEQRICAVHNVAFHICQTDC
jgi:hypothetical protein